MNMQAISDNNKATPPLDNPKKTRRPRGRPVGSGRDETQLAKEQEQHRALVREAFPSLRFDTRRQTADAINPTTGKRTATDAWTMKNLHHTIGERTGKSLRKDNAVSAYEYLLATNQFDPVVEYIRSCKGKESKLSWEDICFKIFKTKDALAVNTFKKWLIGGISRPLEPGSVMDWVMILVGQQGIGKSAIGRALTPSASWFGELTADVDMLIKEPQRMQMSWINELAEVDSMTCGRKADREKMKNLISTREDITRIPYATHPERIPRAFVFYGNTNRSEFITDTESRRTFMIQIPEGNTIDFEWAAANRDAIWGKALAAYESGESCIWTRSEYEAIHRTTMQYRIEDPIESLLDDYIASLERVSIPDIIKNVLQVPPHLQDRSHSRRVTELMEARGWIKYSTSIKQPTGGSKSARLFKRPPGMPKDPTPLTDF